MAAGLSVLRVWQLQRRSSRYTDCWRLIHGRGEILTGGLVQ